MAELKGLYFLSPASFRRDGRLKVGDEIVNVNGRRLRGISMEDAKDILKNYCISGDNPEVKTKKG